MGIWIRIDESHDRRIEAKELCISRTLPFAQTSIQIVCRSTNFKEGDIAGTTKERTISWTRLGLKRRLSRSVLCTMEKRYGQQGIDYVLPLVRKHQFSIYRKSLTTSLEV